jgi:hypothetical protein
MFGLPPNFRAFSLRLMSRFDNGAGRAEFTAARSMG